MANWKRSTSVVPPVGVGGALEETLLLQQPGQAAIEPGASLAGRDALALSADHVGRGVDPALGAEAARPAEDQTHAQRRREVEELAFLVQGLELARGALELVLSEPLLGAGQARLDAGARVGRRRLESEAGARALLGLGHAR